MSLYRKYRPAKFGDVVGQEESIKNASIHHAYLFAGSRGIGKTSVARIFATAIGTKPADLFEIDAASNSKVEEMRDLTEKIRTLPFDSKYKVYIIDEAHMLSRAAFNALLKTLEEPPPHVIFILATTEQHKLPETIVSRCQSFTFRKPTEEEINKLIARAVLAEGYKIDKDSAALISLLADGSYRDALTYLEKAVSVSPDKSIEINEVEKVTGAPKAGLVQKFAQALADGDQAQALAVLEQVRVGNLDARIFTKLALRIFRFGMLLVFAPELGATISTQVSGAEFSFAQKMSRHPSAKNFPNVLRELLSAYADIELCYISILPIELAVLRLLSPKT